MKTQSAKAKGRNLQKWVRQMLIEILDVHPEDVESRSMGAGGEDLIMARAARQKFPHSIECKNVERLKKEGEDVTSLIGKQQEYEQKSRILVGTASKTGTGFDHPRLDAMILASDLQAYFKQYMGRVCRTETVIPIIFDIVDKNPILEKHYQVRKAAYIEHGGTVKDFSKEFPDFKIV